jgi:hypothetical protein
VTVLHPVREASEASRRKRVENRQKKYARSDRVERLDLHAHGEIGCERLLGAGWVTLQRPRNCREPGRLVAHRGTELRTQMDMDRVVMIVWPDAPSMSCNSVVSLERSQ